jgi:hypothetical protein
MVRIPIAVVLSSCVASGGGNGSDADADTDADVDTDADTDTGSDADADADTDAGTDTDTGSASETDSGSDTGTGAGDVIADYCEAFCGVCVGGDDPWESRPAAECPAECAADLADCSESDRQAIMSCAGGGECPEGLMEWGFCVAEYACVF